MSNQTAITRLADYCVSNRIHPSQMLNQIDRYFTTRKMDLNAHAIVLGAQRKLAGTAYL